MRGSDDSRLDLEPLSTSLSCLDFPFISGKSFASEPCDNRSLVRPFCDDSDERFELQELRGRFSAEDSEAPIAEEARPLFFPLLMFNEASMREIWGRRQNCAAW